MKKFIAKLLLLASSVVVIIIAEVIFGIFIVGNQYQYSYNASMIDKVTRLKSINTPKIILIGDSNVAYGIHSPMIQEAMNMPVVNMGLHGSLGNAFHESMAALNINSGDIVIECAAVWSEGDSIVSPSLAWTTVEYHKDLWEGIRPKNYYDMFITYQAYWIDSFKRWLHSSGDIRPENTSYARLSFNDYGDVVFKPVTSGSISELKAMRKQNFKEKVSSSLSYTKITDECVNRLNNYNDYVKSKGAVFLVAGYPIGLGEYTPPVERYTAFQEELARRLDCDVISDYRDYFIPYEYFYDTILHLSEEGAKIRTAQLVKDLLKWKAGY